jgi:hypothetical protein
MVPVKILRKTRHPRIRSYRQPTRIHYEYRRVDGKLSSIPEDPSEVDPSLLVMDDHMVDNQQSSDVIGMDTETPLGRLLSAVEVTHSRFNGSLYGKADPIKSDEINEMHNERIKDLLRILVSSATKMQTCDVLAIGPDDPDREIKHRDSTAQAFQHLAFLMELVTLGLSHLLAATEKISEVKIKLVYTDNVKAYQLKAGIDKYLCARFMSHTH